MITKQMRKDVKSGLYSQLFIALIYVIIGITISIIRGINFNYLFDQSLLLGIIMLFLGLFYTIKNTLILSRPKALQKRIVKIYDPSNLDIKLKSIKRAYYSFYALGLILATLMAEKLSEVSAGIIIVMTSTLFLHVVYWLYFKISYNLKNSKESDDEGGEELNE